MACSRFLYAHALGHRRYEEGVEVSIDVDFEADELLALARLDIEAGRLDRALSKLKQAVSIEGDLSEAVVELARLYAQLGLQEKAKPLFRGALDQNGENPDLKFQFGMVCFETGEIEVAMGQWSSVLEISPAYPPALYFRAVAHLQAGRKDEARKSLQQVFEKVSSDNLYFERAKLLMARLDSETAAAAEATSETMPILRPESPYKVEH